MRIITPSIICIVALIVINLDFVVAQTVIQKRLDKALDEIREGESATKTRSVPSETTLRKDPVQVKVKPITKKSDIKRNPPKAGPDERKLWRYYHQRKIGTLEKTISNWKKLFSGWVPPEELTRLIREHNLQLTLNRTLAAGDLVQLEKIRESTPQLFSCTKIDNNWRLARIQAANGNTESAFQTYSYIIDQCGDKYLAATTLQKAKADLPIESYIKLLDRAEGKVRKTALSSFRYNALKERLISALNQENNVEVDKAVELLTSALTIRRDAALATHLGWYRYKQKKLKSSLAWFEKANRWHPTNEEAAYGLALASRDLNKTADVKMIAKRFPLSKRLQHLNGNILLADGWQALKEGDLKTSRNLAVLAGDTLGSTRSLSELNAWLDYGDGEYSSAANAFEKLYQFRAEPSVGRGMVLSYSALKDRNALARLRGLSDELLLEELSKIASQEEYYNKSFLAAYQSDPDYSDTLRNIDSPSVEVGMVFRHRPGDDGLDQLDVELQPVAAATYNHNIHQFRFQASRLRLTNGHPDNCVPVGSLAIQIGCASEASLVPGGSAVDIDTSAAYVQSPTTVVEATAYELAYSMDGRISPYFSIGLTPDGPVGRAFSFRGGLEHQLSWLNYRLEGFSQPVKESILSYTGMNDPYSNRQWGRVLKSGGSIDLHYKPNEDWRLTGQLTGAVFNGKGVADNWMISGTTGLAYSIDIPEFDYLTVGPTVTLQHYDENLNHYTLGHGGYFSPDFYANTGLGLNFLTNEGQKYIAKGMLFGGYQYFDENKAPWFPTGSPSGFSQNASTVIRKDGEILFSGTPFYDGNQDDGISFSAEVKGAVLVHPHLQYGGGFFARKTADYEDYGAGIYLRVFLSPRKASFSTDLPNFLFQSVQ